MASTYSQALKIELIGNGDQSGTWGNTTNNNLGTLIEQAITGVQYITMGNASYTLSNFNGVSDEARNAVIVATGTNSAIQQVICPLVNKMYVVSNQTSGGYAITVGGATGALVTIPNGVTAQVYCDGTNFYSSQTGSAGNFTVNGNFTATGSESVTGNLGVGGTLTVTGASTFTGNAAFSGAPTAPTAPLGNSTTQLATTAFVQANGAPTGSLLMWPTATAPTGYLLCTGTAVSRTTYATLFALIGTTFGIGDGVTTFNLPNYTNRMPYGTTIGAIGGTADAVVVSHTHTATVTDPGHNHTVGPVPVPIGLGLVGGANAWAYSTTLTSSTVTTGISVANSTEGVSGTGQNLPPYLGINFIIKT